MENTDIQQAMTTAKSKDTTDQQEEGRVIVTRYNDKGQPDTDNDGPFADSETVAVKRTIDKRSSYWVKQARNGNLFDPRAASSTYNLSVNDRITKNTMFVLRECGAEKFNGYIEFLQSRNGNKLVQAQRSV